jgi:uncharacterized Zn finger protein (UPF0148 family)
MIEFDCEHCSTHISLAPDQMEGEIFCPACDLEVQLPELSPEMEAKLAIARAQAKNIPAEPVNPDKAKKILQEPDSKETTVWKERLAESFKVTSFREYKPPESTEEKPEKEEEPKGIKRIFGIFSDKKK